MEKKREQKLSEGLSKYYTEVSGWWGEMIDKMTEEERTALGKSLCDNEPRYSQAELDRAREEVEKKFREKYKKRAEEMNVPYSEEDGKEFWQGYQEGYNQGLHDMIIDTYYLNKEFQSKLNNK